MMTGRIPVVVVVLVLLGAVPATAQTAQQERLKGLTALRVNVTPDNDDTAACGISETALTTAVSKALLDNGIRVEQHTVDSTVAPYLEVLVNNLHLEAARVCVTNVTVNVGEWVYATPKHSNLPVYGRFELLSNIQSLATSSPADHGQTIRDMVFNIVEAIAVDIRLANQ